MKARENTTAWLMMAPALLVLAVFGIFPIFYAFYVSLHAWRIRQGEVVGLGHYLRALGDPAHLGLAVMAAALIWLAWRWGRRGSRTGETEGEAAPPEQEQGSRGRTGVWVVASLAVVAAAVFALGIALAGLADSGDLRLYNGFKITLFYVLGTIPA